jgi:hypothetical protein
MAVRRLYLLAAWALLLSGCGPRPVGPTPTAQPVASVRPTVTSAPAPAADNATPKENGGERPPEAIAIERPGPGSSAVSPLHISGISDPTFENHLGVRLMGMDGSLIAEGSGQIEAPIGERGPFQASLDFEVRSKQPALLQVFDSSARDGGIIHLNSVVVQLLPSGPADVQSAPIESEHIQILAPAAGEVISAGHVTVRGFGIGSFEGNLVVELADASGNQLSIKPVTVDAPEMGEPGPFAVTLSYSVPEEQPGRVVIRDPSPAFAGAVHLASVEVQLQP